MNKISVIIPCFNSEKTIENAIQSVINQTLPPDEIICIDDCSNDKTSSIINALQKSSPKIKIKLYENKTNLGPSISRNIGISEANGKWIAFIDADDEWHPQKLEVQISALTKHSLDFIGGSFSYNKYTAPIPSCHVKEISFRDLLYKNYFPTPSVVLSKDISLNFDPTMRYAEDYSAWLELAKQGVKMGHISTPLIFLNKPSYGHSGLSANLLLMQKGELLALRKALGTKNITSIFFQFFSLLKFTRRIVIVYFRRLFKAI